MIWIVKLPEPLMQVEWRPALLLQAWLTLAWLPTFWQIATHILKFALSPAHRANIRRKGSLEGKSAVAAFPVRLRLRVVHDHGLLFFVL